MIIWSGRGIFSVIVLVAVFFLGINFLPEGLNEFAITIALFTAAIFSWVYGKKWNQKRILIDEQTGKRVVLKSNHSLFFIKMKYWGVIFFLLGCYVCQLEIMEQGGTARNNFFVTNLIWISLGAIFVVYVLKKVNKSHKKKKNTKMSEVIHTQPTRNIIKNKMIDEITEIQEAKVDKEDNSRFMPK